MDPPIYVEAARGDARLVALGQYAVPEQFTATIASDDPTLPVCRLAIAVREGRPVCRAVTIEVGPDGEQIDGAAIRAVRLSEYVKRSIDAVALWILPTEHPTATVHINLPGEPPQQLPSEPFDDTHVAIRLAGVAHTPEIKSALRPARRAGAITDEKLREVADVYRAAYNAHRPPTKAVMEHWHVERSTASRWVKRTRDAGYLGRARPRTAGEGG
jgi:hypothetical protein